MVVAIALTWRFKLGQHEVLDFTPSMDWAAPVLAETPEPDSGPVMVTIEYRVQPDKRAEFVAAMQAVREMRRRNGAYFWELFHDSADPTRFIECFMDESWLEHLRQHERVERRRSRDPAPREAVSGRGRRRRNRRTGWPTGRLRSVASGRTRARMRDRPRRLMVGDRT